MFHFQPCTIDMRDAKGMCKLGLEFCGLGKNWAWGSYYKDLGFWSSRV